VLALGPFAVQAYAGGWIFVLVISAIAIGLLIGLGVVFLFWVRDQKRREKRFRRSVRAWVPDDRAERPGHSDERTPHTGKAQAVPTEPRHEFSATRSGWRRGGARGLRGASQRPALTGMPEETALGAQSLLQMGRPAAAIDLLRPAIASSPDNYMLYQVAAIAYGELQRNEEAIAAAREAVALKPDSGQLQMILAHRLIMANRATEAVKPALAAIRLQPEVSGAQAAAAEALRRSGDRAAAMKHAREAVRMNPERHQGALGRVLLSYGRWEEADQAFRRALVTYPEGWDIHFYLALSLVPQGRVDEARKLLENFLARHPDNPPVSMLRERLERWQEAESSLRRAITTGDGQTSRQTEMASLLISQDRLAEAAEILESVVADKPENREVRAQLQHVLARVKESQRGEDIGTPAMLALEQELEEEYQLRLKQGQGSSRDSSATTRAPISHP
jgi:tetratricopeptide (TPR) repeat protein